MSQQHRAHFEASGGGLVLTNAILLYRDRPTTDGHQTYAGQSAGPAAFASMHAVDREDDGSPTIAAGTPLTRTHLRQWTEALGRTVDLEILPANVLIAHPDVLAWWVPEQVRQAYFALSAPPPDMRILSKRVTVPVPYPAHLFVATRRGLSVYALAENRRPDADTVLLHSPILNVFADGQLCWGNISRPRGLACTSIPDFERAVFDSWSTHPNPGQELTISGKGGLQRLWDDLAARGAKRFPVRRLRPFGTAGRRRSPRTPEAGVVTFGMLIAGSRRS